ncbi:MAG: COQ9 family protein [Rhodospirillales bacterium]
MSPADDRATLRAALMTATLRHVPFDGWSRAALAAAARDVGLTEGEVARLFPGGPMAVLAAFEAWADTRMAETVAAADLADARVTDRVAFAVMARLDALAPHREAVRRAAGHYALPLNVGRGLAALGRTVDAIWRAAGDRAADFSWYTRRGLLAGVYGATLLCWLDDRTEGSAETRAFLARRLSDVGQLGRLPDAMARAARHAPNPCRIFAGRRAARRWAPPRTAG